jgi:protein-export membrane protein SecD
MKFLGLKFAAILILTLLALGYILPLKELGVNLPFDTGAYRLGLDLHGGVELDYKIDFAGLKERGQVYTERDVTEGLKSIVEKRVNSLGTAEPTITSAKYGDESHIIVQIPTQSFKGENLSEEGERARNEQYINDAKNTIGKVVRLEFKEKKTDITEADRVERRKIADAALNELSVNGANFESTARKFVQNNEAVTYGSGSKTEIEKLPTELSFSGFTNAKVGTTRILESTLGSSLSIGADGKLEQLAGEKVYIIANIIANEVATRERTITATGATQSGSTASGAASTGVTKTEKYPTREITYQVLTISQKASEWTPAKTADGKILDEKYLTRAGISYSNGFTPQVDLIFNDDGKAIFGELTKRLISKPIAIFVGGQLITAPTVQTAITDGHAVITGNYTADSAKALANDINTGIVPAPIYLTSERAIDAKIGADALGTIIRAGVIGLIAIVLFLTVYYRVSGLLAGTALVIYAILLVTLFKAFGIVLTLASIAGMILSIGLAIDANILIFERTKEAIREGSDLTKAAISGFNKSWTAIWDSHVTSFTSAIVLYIFGTSLIKGFGLALGLGILLSLFTAMWVSRILILLVSKKFMNSTKAFIGQK